MLKITKATTEDAPTIATMGRTTFVQAFGHSGPAEEIETYVGEKFAVSTIENELADPKNIFHLALYENKLAGYSKIIHNFPNPNIPHANISKLERLYLLSEFHDLGLGRKLFEFNKELSQKANQAGMWLYTWTKNHRAMVLYKKVGFESVGMFDFRLSPNLSNPNHVMWLSHTGES